MIDRAPHSVAMALIDQEVERLAPSSSIPCHPISLPHLHADENYPLPSRHAGRQMPPHALAFDQ
jgi:hypothetical protein